MTEREAGEARSADSQALDPKELDRIERLRDRTDEIELIISGLTTFALFALPGWLFDAVSARYSHHSSGASQVFDILLILAPGVFYALGGCFAVHLMIRAYWAGLAGLRSVYPGGILWDRVPGVGRLTRKHYQQRLPDLSRAIASADHAASALFSVISMTALSMLWISVLMIAALLLGQAVGDLLGGFDRSAEIALWVLVGMFTAFPLALWFLDSVLGGRFPALLDRPVYGAIVRALIRVNAWIWPQRLILPVQLTLQTNTRPHLFSMLIALSTVGIILVGFVRFDAWTQFSVSDQFRYLDTEQIEGGIDSAHYENLRGVQDRLRPVPTIDAFEQDGAFVRVFLPYYPRRDNPALDARCTADVEPVDCLRDLWSVALGDRSTDPSGWLPTERRDLNQRGLTVVLPLTGLVPGMHWLEIQWDGSPEPIRYVVPFLFAPAQELSARELGASEPSGARF